MFLDKLIEKAKQQSKKGVSQHNILYWFSNELWANGIQINMEVTQYACDNTNVVTVSDDKMSADENIFENQNTNDLYFDRIKAAAVIEPKNDIDAAYIKAANAALNNIEVSESTNTKSNIDDKFDSKTAKTNKSTKMPIYIYRNYDGSYRMSFKNTKFADSEIATDNLKCLDKQSLVTRLILCDNKKTKANTRVWNECQGIVIDSINWAIIAIPNNNLLRYPSQKIVDPCLKAKDYHLLPIIDGTTITMYYCKTNGWSIASRRGYDVSTLKWSGPKTYSELFFELLERLHPNIIEISKMSLSPSKRLIIENNVCFDTEHCYTFLFRHHDFHPLKHDPEGIWFIQSVMLKTHKKSYETILDIPCQKSISYDDETTLNSLKKSKTGYGFILRCKEYKSGPDILIETPLMTNIRKLIYNIDTNYAAPEDRILYVSIRAYLGKPILYTEFSQYFPEMSDLTRQLSNLISNQVIKILSLITDQKRITIDNEDHSLTGEVIRFLIKNNLLLSIRAVQNKEKILKDIIMDTQFTSHVLKCYKESISE